MPQISVIIPVFNAAETLESCLEGLEEQDIPSESYEIIVVDNNSSDASLEMARRHPRVRVYCETRQSAYAARNRALRAAQGGLIAFTDADCVPRRDWLRQLSAPMADPKMMVVMGRGRPAGITRAIQLLAEYEHCKEAFVMSSADPAVYYGHTNNLITRKEVFGRLGAFDERPRGADTIFVQRVLEHYGTQAVRYHPGAVVDHLEIISARTYFHKAFIYGRSARSYCQIVQARRLSYGERLQIFRAAVNSCKLSRPQAGYLFALLMLGVVSYGFGWVSLPPGAPARELS